MLFLFFLGLLVLDNSILCTDAINFYKRFLTIFIIESSAARPLHLSDKLSAATFLPISLPSTLGRSKSEGVITVRISVRDINGLYHLLLFIFY